MSDFSIARSVISGFGIGGFGNWQICDLQFCGSARKSSGLSRYSNDFRHVIEEPLKVGAFNVRRFGTAKMKDKEVVDILVRIIRQFDVIVIQEIVDTKERAINELVNAVNKSDLCTYKHGDEGNLENIFKLELSPRVGRKTQKEQYGLIYRSTKLSVEESCIYPDPGDVFIREPFIVKFSTNAVNDINSFTMISVHTQPKVRSNIFVKQNKPSLFRMQSQKLITWRRFTPGLRAE